MLISFKFKNWKSFKEETEFSMMRTKERQHGHRLSFVKKLNTSILPTACIYGGNASGKTNFFEALQFCKNFITKGTISDQKIPVNRFKLMQNEDDQISSFNFIIRCGNKVFEYGFKVNEIEVVEEYLNEILSKGEKQLFHRYKKKKILLFESKDSAYLKDYVFRGTRKNQLFLTNSIDQNVKVFENVYYWFHKKLTLISPNTTYKGNEVFEINPINTSSSPMTELLSKLDTGISSLSGEELDISRVKLPERILSIIKDDLTEENSIRIEAPDGSKYVFQKDNDEIVVKKLVAEHEFEDGKMIKFDIQEESDGTKRVIDLLPAFIETTNKSSLFNKVFIIDEIDRSLHSLMTRSLLETFLKSCNKDTRFQLIFTTHDILLMTQDLFRRDEMWLTERDKFCRSTLFSLSEFEELRNDKQLRKNYLNGRFGGIPKILLSSFGA